MSSPVGHPENSIWGSEQKPSYLPAAGDSESACQHINGTASSLSPNKVGLKECVSEMANEREVSLNTLHL